MERLADCPPPTHTHTRYTHFAQKQNASHRKLMQSCCRYPVRCGCSKKALRYSVRWVASTLTMQSKERYPTWELSCVYGYIPSTLCSNARVPVAQLHDKSIWLKTQVQILAGSQCIFSSCSEGLGQERSWPTEHSLNSDIILIILYVEYFFEVPNQNRKTGCFLLANFEIDTTEAKVLLYIHWILIGHFP